MVQTECPIFLLERWVAAGRPGCRQYRIDVWGEDRLVTLLAKVDDDEVVDCPRYAPTVLEAVRKALLGMADVDRLSALSPSDRPPAPKRRPGRPRKTVCPATASRPSSAT